MDFKDRFKGKTSIVSKEGIINTLAAPSNNPVLKSSSNTVLPSSTPINQHSSYSQNNTYQRFNLVQSPGGSGGKPPLPSKHPASTFAKNSQIDSAPYSGHLSPSQSFTGSPGKTPYLVHNPMPNLDPVEHYGPGYNQPEQNYPQQMSRNYWNPNQPTQNHQFNPHSFYNQHSQYKKDSVDLISTSQKLENKDLYVASGGFTANQQAKKKFETLSQQNKQRKLAEDVMRGFENHNPHYLTADHYHGSNQGYNHNQGFPTHNGFNYHQPLPMQGHRESHSNPPPQQQYEGMGYAQMGMPRYHDQEYQYEYPKDRNPNIIRSGSNRTGYKPYNLKDYKEFKVQAAVQLGGLGPNLHTDAWQKEKEKREKMAEFSQNLKMLNSRKVPSTETSFKPRREKEKEKSRREIALEFAKYIPAPKTKARREFSEDNEMNSQRNRGGNQERTFGELDEYEKRHLNYLTQLEMMKYN